MITKGLLLAATISIATPLHAQLVAAPTDPAPQQNVVEGDTADRVAQIEGCQGHKFESRVEIDPVTKRSTRVKLCANPGASDADWVKTLEAAVAQIEQRDMPAAAKEQLIGELNGEIAKYAAASKPATSAQGAPLFIIGDAGAASTLIAPTERYETSILPPLTPKVAAKSNSAVASVPLRPMRIRLKCLERGQSGSGGTCDFFVADTILAISAVEGLEDGGTLRFRRKGDARGEVALAPLLAGQSVRIKLPVELCRGVANSKVEIELLAPKSTGAVAARLGPFGLRC